jgi:hypothetical protein
MQIIPFILAALLGVASLIPGVGNDLPIQNNDDERVAFPWDD